MLQAMVRKTITASEIPHSRQRLLKGSFLLMEYVGMAAREEGGEAWYSDRMRKLGLQVTELKKRKESIQEQEKKREEYEYLDREIS